MIEEAERIIDEIGLPRLTLSAIAERLGVRQPSLYKHVDGMDALRRSLSLRAKHEVANVLAHATVGRERANAIVAYSDAYRAWAKEHPGRYEAVQLPPDLDDAEDVEASQASLQIIIDILAAYRLRDDDAIDAIRTLRSALHGFVDLEVGGSFALPVNIDRSFERMVRGLITTIEHWTEQTAPIEKPA